MDYDPPISPSLTLLLRSNIYLTADFLYCVIEVRIMSSPWPILSGNKLTDFPDFESFKGASSFVFPFLGPYPAFLFIHTYVHM